MVGSKGANSITLTFSRTSAAWLGTVATLVVVAGGFYIHTHVPLLIHSEVQTQIAPVTERLVKVEVEIELLLRKNSAQAIAALPWAIRGASTDEDKLKIYLEFAAQTFKDAKEQSLYTNPDDVAQVGKAIIDVAKGARISVARDAALAAAIAYRSSLNVHEAPATPNARQVPLEDFWAIGTLRQIPGASTEAPTLWIVPERDPASPAALFTRMGEEATSENGPGFIILDAPGKELALDGSHLRRVIIRNAKIIYHGGSVELEGVYFLNCSFDIGKSDRGTKFESAVLLTPDVTFGS